MLGHTYVFEIPFMLTKYYLKHTIQIILCTTHHVQLDLQKTGSYASFYNDKEKRKALQDSKIPVDKVNFRLLHLHR